MADKAYRLLQRVTLDGHRTIHEVGEILTLAKDEAESLLKQGAVELAKGEKAVDDAVKADVKEGK